MRIALHLNWGWRRPTAEFPRGNLCLAACTQGLGPAIVACRCHLGQSFKTLFKGGRTR